MKNKTWAFVALAIVACVLMLLFASNKPPPALDSTTFSSATLQGGRWNERRFEGDSLVRLVGGINVAVEGIDEEAFTSWTEPMDWIVLTTKDGIEVTVLVWADRFGAMQVGEKYYTIGHGRHDKFLELLKELTNSP